MVDLAISVDILERSTARVAANNGSPDVSLVDNCSNLLSCDRSEFPIRSQLSIVNQKAIHSHTEGYL